MTPEELATLSLLDHDQGVCPDGHACVLDAELGLRRCAGCDYRGHALICWEITETAIAGAARARADEHVVAVARAFLSELCQAPPR